MADQIAVVQFTTRATMGTQSVTSPDITETARALILIWGNSTTQGANETPARMGIAVCALDTGALESQGGAASTLLRNAAATPQTITGVGNEDVVLLCTDASGGAGGFDIVAVVDSVTAGGVVLDFTTVTGGAQVDVTAIILAGDDMRVWGGNAVNNSTTPVQEDCGSSGPPDTRFEPDIIVTIPTLNSLDSAVRNTVGYAGLGGATDSAQKVTHVNWRAGVEPSEVDGTVQSARGGASFNGLTRPLTAHLYAFNAQGFTVANSGATPTADARMRYLAIKFGDPTTQFGVVNEAISGSGGNQDFTELGFTPTVVVGCSSLMTAEDTQVEDETASALGYFIAGADASHAATIREEEGLTGVSAVSARQEDVALLTYDHLGSVAQRATWVGGVSGGFRLNFSTATAGFFTAIGFATSIPPVIATDTETISDGAVVFLNRTLVLDETVTITDGVVVDSTDVSDTEGPQGTTFQAYAERGTSLAAGAVAGTTRD